ncbi:MAG: 3-oxoacyl-ACP reductase family protein [Candidatus Hodarchaeota archaeon]
MKLEGKIAIVTGAGSPRGIGRASAMALASEGANLVVNDMNLQTAEETVKEIKKLNRDAILACGDVSKADEVTGMISQALEAYGRIDILVNNAGIDQKKLVIDMSEDDWDKMIRVNLKSIFLCSQAVLKTMLDQRTGRIINISSLAAKQGGGIFGGAHYCASKAGVIGFTKGLAKEVASYGINVNAIAPGVILTNLVDWDKDVTPEIREKVRKGIPLERFGTPEEVAEVVLFLASDSSNYITGAVIDINGGLLMD